MAACRRAYKKHKPDIVMYVDRADVIRRNFEDEPLLRTITQVRQQGSGFRAAAGFCLSMDSPSRSYTVDHSALTPPHLADHGTFERVCPDCYYCLGSQASLQAVLLTQSVACQPHKLLHCTMAEVQERAVGSGQPPAQCKSTRQRSFACPWRSALDSSSSLPVKTLAAIHSYYQNRAGTPAFHPEHPYIYLICLTAGVWAGDVVQHHRGVYPQQCSAARQLPRVRQTSC